MYCSSHCTRRYGSWPVTPSPDEGRGLTSLPAWKAGFCTTVRRRRRGTNLFRSNNRRQYPIRDSNPCLSAENRKSLPLDQSGISLFLHAWCWFRTNLSCSSGRRFHQISLPGLCSAGKQLNRLYFLCGLIVFISVLSHKKWEPFSCFGSHKRNYAAVCIIFFYVRLFHS